MNFQECIREGFAKETKIDIIRAKNLIKSASESIDTAKNITLKESSLKSIFRELYEGLRQYCEAIGYTKGYKFLSHDSVTYFLRDNLKEDIISNKFDRYRILRNGINYYGDSISQETVEEAKAEIPKIINILSKYTIFN